MGTPLTYCNSSRCEDLVIFHLSLYVSIYLSIYLLPVSEKEQNFTDERQ